MLSIQYTATKYEVDKRQNKSCLLCHTNSPYFGSVSINEEEEDKKKGKKSSAQRQVNEFMEKITNLIKKEDSDLILKFDGNLEEITKEIDKRRHDIIKNQWFFINRSLKKVDKLEAKQKKDELRNKGFYVEESIASAEKANKLAEEMPESLARLDTEKDIKRNRELEAIRQIRANFDQQKGFSRIAGYVEEKWILEEFFMNKILEEKSNDKVKVPGSILFFGPTGNGKTTFAKAFAEETGCTIVPIEPDFDLPKKEKEQDFMKELYSEAKEAEKRFKKDKKRTILFIDEVTKVADKDSSILPEFEKFLKICSDDYHCTVFAATNHPFNLGLDMYKATTFPYRVSMNPPNQENMSAVLEHYLHNRTSEQIDYSLLAIELGKTGKEKNGSFSNSQIKEICLKDNKAIVSKEDMLNRIKVATPAIDEVALKKFNEEEANFMPNKINLNEVD